MANIQPFDTGALSLRPTEEGINTIAGNARRVGAFYNQQAGALEGLAAADKNAFNSAGRAIGSGIQAAGDAYVNYEDHKQISHGAAVGTEAVAKLDGSLNDAVKKADPNDSSFASKFMETEFEPWADKFREQFTTEKGQQFAEQFIDRYRQHFTTKAAADLSTQAGIAAKENAGKTINNLSSMVYNDPSSLDTAIDTMKHAATHIVGSSPTIDAETGAKVTSELNQKGIESLVKSAVTGMISKNPNVDLDAIQKKYGDYINGGELKMFQKQAQVQARTDAAAVRADAINKRTQADQEMHAGSNKVINDNVSIDQQTGRPVINPNFFKQTLDLARKNPDAPSAASTVRTMLDWGESQQKKEDNVTNPETRVNLLQGMTNANKPTSLNDVLRAEIDGKLSNRDAMIMKQMLASNEKGAFTDPVFAGVMASAKTQIEESIDGHERYGKFFYSFARDYQTKLAAGTLEPNALDPNDPNSMISKAMGPFKPTPAEKMQYHMLKSVGGLPEGVTLPGTPKPGPSVAPPTKVSTPADAEKLKPGTRYQTPDGKVYVR